MIFIWLVEQHCVWNVSEIQPLDLTCGTLFWCSCAMQTSPVDCSYHCWRDTFFSSMNTVLCEFWYAALYKSTYLLTYLHVLVQFVRLCVLEDRVYICSDTVMSAATVNSLRRWAWVHSYYSHCLFSLSAKVLPWEDNWRTRPNVKSPKSLPFESHGRNTQGSIPPWKEYSRTRHSVL